MSQAKAVVFDIGNVLLHWDASLVLRPFFSSADSYNAFLEQTRLMWLNLEFDAGRPFADGIAELTRRFPEHQAPLQAFDDRWAECVPHAIEENVATLRALKAAGHPVHAITNFSREKFDIARKRFDFLDVFDHTLVSADIGLLKPDYRIYHRFCHDTGLAPEDILFVDDSAVNIAAAKAVGYRVFHMATTTTAACEAFRTTLRENAFKL